MRTQFEASVLTSCLGMDLRGSTTAPLASSKCGLKVTHTQARADVQAAAQGSCMQNNTSMSNELCEDDGCCGFANKKGSGLSFYKGFISC
jgi:hypothetical protein